MSQNHIEEVRARLRQLLDTVRTVADSRESHTSPSGRYKLTTQAYSRSNPSLAKQLNLPDFEVKSTLRVEVYPAESNEPLFVFFTTYHRFFFSWITRKGHELLVCAEDLYGGQTVIDLTNKKMSSYSPNIDGFIWTEHFISPSGNLLAVSGCVWAAPYWVNIYDFSDPLTLPLPLVGQLDWDAYEGVELIGWLDDNTLRVKGGDNIEKHVAYGPPLQ